mmetsp:Transcript_3022/g.6534  ORF Transcript_3022/g.6534 Transcript_3022/m.6534 type:complete len:180 (-) Transcript_3022:1348-1887(-)
MVRGPPYRTSFRALAEAGVIKKPVWLSAMESVPSVHLKNVGGAVRDIRFREDVLRKEFLKRNRALKSAPFDLNAETKKQAHAAERFAARQLELMEEGVSQEDAYEGTERELKNALGAPEYTFASEPLAEGLEEGSNDQIDDNGYFDRAAMRLYRASVKDAKREEQVMDVLRRTARNKNL